MAILILLSFPVLIVSLGSAAFILLYPHAFPWAGRKTLIIHFLLAAAALSALVVMDAP